MHSRGPWSEGRTADLRAPHFHSHNAPGIPGEVRVSVLVPACLLPRTGHNQIAALRDCYPSHVRFGSLAAG
jgi:hypothetical protein